MLVGSVSYDDNYSTLRTWSRRKDEGTRKFRNSNSSMKQVLSLLKVESPDWNKVLQAIRENDDQTSAVDFHSSTGTSALHIAAGGCGERRGEPSTGIRHSTSDKMILRLAVIDALLQRHPEATALRCREKGYTPLSYAVHTTDFAAIDDDAEIIKALLKANPAAIHLKPSNTSHPFQICLHIWSVSLLARQQPPPSLASTSVLQVLIAFSDLPQLERALETIFVYNTVTIMERFSEENILHSKNVQQFGRHTRASDRLANFWVWEWVLCILKGIHNMRHNKKQPQQAIPQKGKNTGTPVNATMPVRAVSQKIPSFHALHTAAKVTDCPIPFLLFAMRAYPGQVRVADHQNDSNLPLHLVASWQPRHSSCRKSMILTSLVAEYPKAVNAKNKQGMNPIDLEAASGAVIE